MIIRLSRRALLEKRCFCNFSATLISEPWKGKGRAFRKLSTEVERPIATASTSKSILNQEGISGTFSTPNFDSNLIELYKNSTLRQLSQIVTELDVNKINYEEFQLLVTRCTGSAKISDPIRSVGLLWNLRKKGLLRDWKFDDSQIRKSFQIAVRVEELLTGVKSRDRYTDQIMLERRRKGLDSWFEDFKHVELRKEDESWLTRYGNLRTRPFTPDDSRSLLHAFSAYQLSFNVSERFEFPEVDFLSSALLTPLFNHYPEHALIHLSSMLSKNRIPDKKDLITIMRADDSEIGEGESYDLAREALADACAIGGEVGKAKLDELMEQRIDYLNKRILENDTPFVAFVEWILKESELNRENGTLAREWLKVGLQFWKTIYISAEEGGFTHISVLPGQMLLKLGKAICKLEVGYQNDTERELGIFDSNRLKKAERKEPSQLFVSLLETIQLHASQALLINSAHLLLKTICLVSPNYILARQFYATLLDRAPSGGINPFQWHASLIPCIEFLIRSSLPIPAVILRDDDPRFIITLYLRVTGDGIVWPRSLYSKLWNSLGREGNSEEISRVITDYEDSGKLFDENAAGHIIRSLILSDSLMKVIRVVKLLEDRVRGQLSISSYNLYLHYLAGTETDRRLQIIKVFSKLLKIGPSPNVEIYNALISSHISRPHIKLADLDSAGTVYNNLLQARIRPNSETFSILIHGFIRFNSTRSIDSALRTFNLANSSAIPINADSTSRLMNSLIKKERWEEAKLVGEAWWRANATSETLEGREAERRSRDEYIMQKTGKKLLKKERSWVSAKAGV